MTEREQPKLRKKESRQKKKHSPEDLGHPKPLTRESLLPRLQVPQSSEAEPEWQLSPPGPQPRLRALCPESKGAGRATVSLRTPRRRCGPATLEIRTPDTSVSSSTPEAPRSTQRSQLREEQGQQRRSPGSAPRQTRTAASSARARGGSLLLLLL